MKFSEYFEHQAEIQPKFKVLRIHFVTLRHKIRGIGK